MPYIRTRAEPRTHNDTPARTAMIQSVYGQMCPSSDSIERALMAIFDALPEKDQHRVLTLLGWESTIDGVPESSRPAFGSADVDTGGEG